MRRAILAFAALASLALTLSLPAFSQIPPCPDRPLGAWFKIGDQCRLKDGRVCTLISVKANLQGNWSCRRVKG